MADNTVLPTGGGGDTVATDDIGGVKYPRSKIVIGIDGTNDGDVAATNPLPTLLRSEVVDDAAFTPATSRVVMIGAEFDDATPDSVDEGDGGAVRMSANRALHVVIRDDAGNERGLKVDANGAIAVTGGGGGTQYVEDTAHNSGDTGTMALAVRNDSIAALAGTSGDYIPLSTDSVGRLWVNVGTGTISAAQSGNWSLTSVTSITNPVAVTQSGTWNISTVTTVSTVNTVTAVTSVGSITTGVVPGTGATSLGKAEDAGHTTGDTGVFVLAVRSDTAAQTAGTDGDYCGLICDSTGKLHVNVGNATLAVTQSGTWNVGTVTTVSTVTAVTSITNPVAATQSGTWNIGTVTSITNSVAVTNAGTFAVQVDGAALTSLQLIDDAVFSDDGIFTPGTSKLLAVGFQADETTPDSVDEGDIGCPRMTLDRKIWVVKEDESSSIRAAGVALTPKFAAIAANTSGDNTLLAAVSSKKIRVLSMAVVAAGAVSLYFTSAAGGTVIFGGSTHKIALAANGGFVLPYNPLGWFETAATQLLNMNLSATVAVSGGFSYCEV